MSAGGGGASNAELSRMMARATSMEELGRYDEAAHQLSALIAQIPDSDVLWSRVAYCRVMLAEGESALQAAEEALRVNPESPQGHSARSQALLNLGRSAEAVSAGREAVGSVPGNTHAHVTLARALRHTPDGAEESVEMLRRAIGMEPNDAVLHFHLGLSLSKSGRNDEAAESMREALRIEPAHVDALASLNVLNAQTGKVGLTESLTDGTRVLALDPQHRSAEHNLDVWLHQLLRRTRWIALGCLVIALPAARVFTTEGADNSMPAPLSGRMYALALIIGICGLCGWLTARRLPKAVRAAARSLCRRYWLIATAPVSAVWCLLGAIVIVAVPWSDRAVPQVIMHVAWIPAVLSMYAVRSVRRAREEAVAAQ